MKLSSLLLLIFLGVNCFSQTKSINNTKNRFGLNSTPALDSALAKAFDPIPISAKQADQFYRYALKLQKEDSLIKAGMIMHRIFMIDSLSKRGQKALVERKKIESKLTQTLKKSIIGKWKSLRCISPWDDNYPPTPDSLGEMSITPYNIVIQHKDKGHIKYQYKTNIEFNWLFGECILVALYDNKEKWLFEFHSKSQYNLDFLEMTIGKILPIYQTHRNDLLCYTKIKN